MRAESKFVFVVRASSRGFLDRFSVVGGAGQPVVGSRLWLAPMRFIKCIHKICCERAARVTVWCYRGPTHAGSGGRGAPVGNGNAASAPTRHPPLQVPFDGSVDARRVAARTTDETSMASEIEQIYESSLQAAG